jgi:hypothetical protein
MAKSLSKTLLKRSREFDKESIEETPEVLDEDATLKMYFTDNVKEIVALIMPDLHAAVDWSVKPEFLEQEFINFLRGKLRQKDKRKVVDKLLKFKLLSGGDHYLYFHNEFQNALPDDLGFRWFKSRMLISLRFNNENITTLIFFTGQAPSKKHFEYDLSCFGARTLFKPNIFVAITQSEKKLIASTNPTALAFLAAKYAAQSKGNDVLRLKLKKKVLNLIEKRNFDRPQLEKIVSFVFDYMLLPDSIDEKLKVEIPFLKPIKFKDMQLSKNRKWVRDALCLRDTGMTFDDYRLDTMEKLEEQKLEAEVAIAAAKEEAEAAKEEAVKAANLKAVVGMLKLGFPVDKIADVLGLELENVKELAYAK